MSDPQDPITDDARRRLVEDLLAESSDAPFEWQGRSFPRRLGRHRLLAPAGSGGHGCVFRAEDMTTQSLVAVKFLHAAASSTGSAARLRQEAKVLAQLEHPGIPRLREVGAFDPEDPLSFHVVMSWVDGEPLDSWRAHHHGDTREFCELIADVAGVVAHAHQKYVIHRDLKPANILIDDAGRPHVVDFGIAHAFDELLRVTGLETGQGEILGTLPYMAPEAVASAGDGADVRSDVFSLGVILLELILGRARFSDRKLTPVQMLDCVRDGAMPAITEIEASVSPDLGAVLRKACARDVEHRYRYVAEFEDDLRRWLRHEPVTARRPTLLERSKLYLRRHPRRALGMATIGIIAAMVLVTIVVLSVFWRDEAAKNARFASTLADLARDIVPIIEASTARMKTTITELSTTKERRARAAELELVVRYCETLLSTDDSGDGGRQDRLVIQETLASAYDLLSDIEMDAGRRSAALSLRERVLRMRQELAARPDADSHDEAEISRAWAKLGDVHGALADRATKIEFYGKALDLDERLHAEHPIDPRHLDDLVWSRLRVGHAEQDILDERPRVPWRADLLELSKRLVALDADRDQSWCTLAEITCHMAMLDGNGELSKEECRKHAETALEIAEARAGGPHPDAKWTLTLFRAYLRIARFECLAGRLEEGQVHYDAARRIGEDLRVRYPESSLPREFLAQIESSMGDVFRKRGENDRAVEHLRAAMEQSQAAHHLDPDRAILRFEYACKVHEWLELSTSVSEADLRTFVDEVLEISMQLHELDAADNDLLEVIAEILDQPVIGSRYDHARADVLRAEARERDLELRTWLAERRP